MFGRDISDEELLTSIKEQVSKLPDEFSKVIGLLSFSKENNISLMWSHYADEHKGFVIGFESTIFQHNQPYSELTEVNYSKERPLYSNSGNKNAAFKQLEELLFTKSINWEYEQEIRSVVRLEHSNKPIKLENSNYLCYLFNFPAESIKEIIVGWKMPLSEREKIWRIISDKYHQVKLFEAKPSESTFDLDILPITE